MLKKLMCKPFITKNKFFLRLHFRNYSESTKLQEIIANYLAPKNYSRPPYHHICQIGDPVLRKKASTVNVDDIKSGKFKKVVDHLIAVMRKYDAFGLSAPQIGMPIQLFAIETTKEHCTDEAVLKYAGQTLEEVPLQIFINPVMKILDYNTTSYPESCASVCGFLANVPRAKHIKIFALNLNGKQITWEAVGWPAKIAQHELDHLNGIIYTDKMDPSTFSCPIWDVVNRRAGKVTIEYFPTKSKFRKYFFT